MTKGNPDCTPKRVQKKFAILLTLLSAGLAPLSAQTELIQNGNFETVGVEGYAAQFGNHPFFMDTDQWGGANSPGGSLPHGLQTVAGWSTQGYHFLMTPGSATSGGAGTAWNDYISFWASNNESLINDTNPEKLVPSALAYIPATSPVGGNFLALDAAYFEPAGWIWETPPGGYNVDGPPWWVEVPGVLKYPDGVNLSLPVVQQVSGLEIGEEYELTFYWAAAQQYGYEGDTWEFLHVSFGEDVNALFAQNSEENKMPEGGFQPWRQETIRFTASSTSQALSFLAGGGPNGQPPFVFLDGVSMKAVPEPGTFVAMGTGLVGLLLARRLRGRGKRVD